MGRIVNESLIHAGAKFDFARLEVSTENGDSYTREVVRHPGAVCVLGVLDDGRVVLIRNDRVAVGGWEWELPAGTLEKGEEPSACALRELTEETGYKAQTAEPLGTFLTTPGMTDELMHAFVARGLTRSEQALEVDERIEVHETTFAEALAMIDNGTMRDAKSMLTLLLAQRRGIVS